MESTCFESRDNTVYSEGLHDFPQHFLHPYPSFFYRWDHYLYRLTLRSVDFGRYSPASYRGCPGSVRPVRV